MSPFTRSAADPLEASRARRETEDFNMRNMSSNGPESQERETPHPSTHEWLVVDRGTLIKWFAELGFRVLDLAAFYLVDRFEIINKLVD
jgi:hypothetical protein